jgi:hypothetical protein
MHASLILLYLYLTFRAWLGIQFDPNGVVIVSPLHFINPLLEDVTMHWLVRLPQAFEAVVIATLAYYIGVLERGILYSVGAVGSGTPLCCFVDVYERFLEVVFVLCIVIRIKHIFEYLLRHYKLASCLRTTCSHTIWA